MLIVDATLWDGTGAEPRRGMALRTEGERIAWMGPSGSAPPGEAGEEVMDAAGRWLLPGLIDLHVHLTADPRQADFMRYIQTTPIPEQTLMGRYTTLTKPN